MNDFVLISSAVLREINLDVLQKKERRFVFGNTCPNGISLLWSNYNRPDLMFPTLPPAFLQNQFGCLLEVK